MNRRLLVACALLLAGLMVGILIGRWFMPDRYGWVTMVLLVLGGILTGAFLTRAVTGSRTVSALSTPEWQLRFAGNRVVFRYDAGWWERARADLRSNANTTSDSLSWFPIGCLFGAVGMALYGQFVFASDKGWGLGLYAYFISIVCFVLLVLLLERPEGTNVTTATPLPDAADSPLTRRWRLGLIFAAGLGALIAAIVGATAARNEPQRETIVIWVSAILLYALAFVPFPRLSQSLRARDIKWLCGLWQRAWKHRLEMILLVAIMGVGFVVRYWHLAWIPSIFGGDEGEMGSEALGILRGELQNPFITGWLSHATLYFFFQSFSLQIFGQSVYGLRVLSVLGGTLSILVTYLLIRRLFHVRLALITAALLAVYNFHIHFSRLAVNNIFDSVFAPLVLLLLYAGLESRRAAYFGAAGLAMGLALYFYHGTRLIPVIVILFGIYLVLTQRELILSNLLNFVWLAIGALIVSGPLLYFFYLHPGDFMARLTQRGIFQSGWYDAQVQSGRAGTEVMLEQVRRSFLAFNAVPDPTSWFGTGEPLLDPLSGMFFVFGCVYAILHLGKKNYALLLIWLVSGVFLGSTLLENPPSSPSFVIVTVPAIFFISLGLDKLLELAARVLRPLARIRWQMAAGFVVLFALWSLAYYFVDYIPRNVYGGGPNWVATALVRYLQERRDPYRVYFVAPPYIYLGIGSRKFLMPDINGEDVIDPIYTTDDLTFVRKSHPALFVFVPARTHEFPIVQEAFPDGVVRNFNKPDGSSLFFIYEVNTP